MQYRSKRHGLVDITDMATPHVQNALNLMEKRLGKTAEEYQVMGALRQALVEREDVNILAQEVKGLKEDVAVMITAFRSV